MKWLLIVMHISGGHGFTVTHSQSVWDTEAQCQHAGEIAKRRLDEVWLGMSSSTVKATASCDPVAP